MVDLISIILIIKCLLVFWNFLVQKTKLQNNQMNDYLTHKTYIYFLHLDVTTTLRELMPKTNRTFLLKYSKICLIRTPTQSWIKIPYQDIFFMHLPSLPYVETSVDTNGLFTLRTRILVPIQVWISVPNGHSNDKGSGSGSGLESESEFM